MLVLQYALSASRTVWVIVGVAGHLQLSSHSFVIIESVYMVGCVLRSQKNEFKATRHMDMSTMQRALSCPVAKRTISRQQAVGNHFKRVYSVKS